jgi:hypothetical protein
MAKEVLEEQKITSFSPEANAYRNINRYKVDKLFAMKEKSKEKKKIKMFDFLARQKWRKIIRESNKL